jgi:DNA-directed RNA polymerase subunit RPC12/RpoP
VTREVEDAYGCFRCGTIRPACVRESDDDKYECCECGEKAIVTLKQALDMINNHYLNNRTEVVNSMEYDQYYPDPEGT